MKLISTFSIQFKISLSLSLTISPNFLPLSICVIMHYAYVSSRAPMHHYILTTMIQRYTSQRNRERERRYLGAMKVRSKIRFEENIVYSNFKIWIYFIHKWLNFKDINRNRNGIFWKLILNWLFSQNLLSFSFFFLIFNIDNLTHDTHNWKISVQQNYEIKRSRDKMHYYRYTYIVVYILSSWSLLKFRHFW